MLDTTKKTSLYVKIIYQIFAKPPPSRIPAYATDRKEILLNLLSNANVT